MARFNNLIDMINHRSKEKKVLSLFDGLGGARLALDEADIPVSEYHASEIDKYASAVSKYNYPDINHVGDVTKLNPDDFKDIDLLIGGSPCFVAGTKVLCKNDYKNIEDIKVGDYVLTHKNKFQKVLATGGSKKTIYKVKAIGIKDTFTTANHPYYVKESYGDDWIFFHNEPIWKEVEKLEKTDFLGIPYLPERGLSLSRFNCIGGVCINNIIWIPLQSIEKMDYEEQVYNLEVENDNSYTANNAIVHNCQSFSFAGKRNGMSTKDNLEITTLEQYLELKEQKFEFDGQSYLFWEYVRLLKAVKPKYFLLENVIMAQKWRDIITNTLFEIQYGDNWERLNDGDKKSKAKFKNIDTEEIIEWDSIIINSALLSAQNRKRQYWTNIKGVTQPKDKGLVIKDIVDKEASDKAVKDTIRNRRHYKEINDKSLCLSATMYKGAGNNGMSLIPIENFIIHNNGKMNDNDVKIGALRGRYLEDGKRKDKKGKSVAGKTTQRLEIRSDDKSNCLTTVQKDNLVVHNSKKECIQVGVAKDINGHDSIKRIYSEEGKSPAVNTCTRGNREPKVAIVTSCHGQENNKLEVEDYIIDKSVRPGVAKNIITNHNNIQISEKDFFTMKSKTGYEDNKIGLKKTPTLRSGNNCTYIDDKTEKLYRKLTPLECERLQTIKDNYTLVPFMQGKKEKMMSSSQRYKMVGNGYTISVIAHILSFMD